MYLLRKKRVKNGSQSGKKKLLNKGRMKNSMADLQIFMGLVRRRMDSLWPIKLIGETSNKHTQMQVANL